MKHLATALSIVALLAPSATFASVKITDITKKLVPPSIVSFQATSGEDASLDWSTKGDERLELTLSCKGKQRVRVEHENGDISYVRCDGHERVAYRSPSVSGDSSGVSLSVTGKNRVDVIATLKAYAATPGKRTKVVDVAHATVKVAPKPKGEGQNH
jgi:hypothetical protein